MSFKRNDLVTQYEMDEAIEGGGGGGGFLVELIATTTDAAYIFTSNKTGQEILNAFNAGIVPVCSLSLPAAAIGGGESDPAVPIMGIFTYMEVSVLGGHVFSIYSGWTIELDGIFDEGSGAIASLSDYPVYTISK